MFHAVIQKNVLIGFLSYFLSFFGGKKACVADVCHKMAQESLIFTYRDASQWRSARIQRPISKRESSVLFFFNSSKSEELELNFKVTTHPRVLLHFLTQTDNWLSLNVFEGGQEP